MPNARKTALVLSAGGMFGAYQAGVWKSLEPRLRPDLVVGASVGALNGWLIAAGISGRELEERWLEPAAADSLRPRGRARFDPAPLQRRAEELMAGPQPLIPFGVVVVELPRLRTLLVEYPDITARHLVATCSIPFVLPPVPIGGRRCVDGGLLNKMPIAAAIQMGAERIVAVDALPPMKEWWLRAGMFAARCLRRRPGIADDVRQIVISPSQHLGSVRDAVSWNRENVARWIALGEKDAGGLPDEIA